VLDIEASSYGRVFGGHFDTVSVFDNNGTIDTSFNVNNVVIKNNLNDLWFGIGSEISDTVKVVKYINGALLFGGSCSNQQEMSDVCMSRYLNGTLQPMYIKYSAAPDYSVNAIAYNGGSKLMFGGNFEIDYMIGT